jgi:hypothetical protein
MKRISFLMVLMVSVGMFGASDALPADEVRYARCNLRVVDGRLVTWANFQSTPMFIPVNTELRVERKGSKGTLIIANSGKRYDLDIGAEGEMYLEKFVAREMVPLEGFPAEIKENITKAVARVGMTKEQVYIAMGPPTVTGTEKTHNLTYEQILRADLWIYARRRFSKNIGVAFDSHTGKVIRTEAMLH